MTSNRRRDHLVLSWTATKGLLTIGLFLVLASISEFFMVSFFAGSGLTETSTYQIPISPLVHILPLAVILVLVSSWIYLADHIAVRPHRVSPGRISKIQRRRQRRTKSTRNPIGAIKNIFNKISSILLRSRGVSSAPQKLSFGRVVFERIVTVLSIFLLSIILLSVLVYPNLFTDFAIGFYSETSPLQGFMQSLAGGMVSIASSLDSIAPSFRNAFEDLVLARTPSLSEGDILWRYVFCQNAAAWISALAALAYVKTYSNVYRSSK